MKIAKEQFDSGGIIFDHKVFVSYREKLETEEDVNTFVSSNSWNFLIVFLS